MALQTRHIDDGAIQSVCRELAKIGKRIGKKPHVALSVKRHAPGIRIFGFLEARSILANYKRVHLFLSGFHAYCHLKWRFRLFSDDRLRGGSAWSRFCFGLGVFSKMT